jgi:hypothetical protein
MVPALLRACTSTCCQCCNGESGNTVRYRGAMVDRFPGKPFSFGALRKIFGPLYLRCDICRRFALLQLGARDVDYRTKRFSCCVCGEEAWLTVTDPRTERGMGDYRLDQREQPERHPRTVERRTANSRQSSVDLTGGELPGRQVDGRR